MANLSEIARAFPATDSGSIISLPLTEWLDTNDWPFSGFLPDNLQQVQVTPPSLDTTTGIGTIGVILTTELALSLPGFDAVKLVLAPAGTSGGGTTEFDFTFAPAPFRLGMHVPIDLRIDASILRPLKPGSKEPDLNATTFDIPLGSVNLALDAEGNVSLDLSTVASVPPCMVGASGVLLSIGKLQWLTPATPQSQLPPNTPAGFTGLFFDNVEVDIPQLPAIANKLGMSHVFLGTDGFSGIISRPGLALQWNGSSFSGDLAGELFGFQGGITGVAVEFRQNALVGCEISGDVFVPYVNKRVGLTLGLDGQGDITATAALPHSTPPEAGVSAGGTGYLLHLDVAGALGLDISALQFVAPAGGLPQFGISGRVTPSFSGLTFPPVDVKDLFIDVQGHVHIQGGWLNLPNQYHLNFYGFTLQIEKLGFGNTSDGGRWIGFNGGLKLIDAMPAGASVDGLRLSWYEDSRSPQISLNGVGITFSVPDVLNFNGSVSYDSSLQKFHGDLTLNLISLDMEVDGKAVFGVQQGQTYFALYLAAEWPAGIPLWATGLGVYGMAGLFALNMEPNKGPGDEWYGLDPAHSWYLRAPMGVIDLDHKWMEQAGALAFGAGVTLGTVSDNGHAFSGRMLLVIAFPGPVLLIEGKASLLQKRASLDKDANFRALAVLDAHAGTLSVNLDARYQYDNAGRLLNIHGGAEAFFNLNDASAWHLYLGEQDHSKRIQAKVFQLFEADTYVMLDAHQLAMGAWIGYNQQWTFGPLSVALQAWLDSNAAVSWKPAHFHGDLWLHGSVVLSAFGASLGLTVDARLGADVFDPFHILGMFSVTLNLPWPLPSPSATVSMEWGPAPTVPALPLPLQEIAIEHLKATTSWPLLRAPGDGSQPLLLPNYDRGDGYLVTALTSGTPPPDPDLAKVPVVPLDCRPHLTFGRAVNDDVLVGVNVQPLVPEWERVGNPSQHEGPVQVRYSLQEVELDVRMNGQWIPVARKGMTPNPANVETLYGSWAPVPQMPDGGGPNVGQTKLWLWSKSNFDYARHTLGASWNEWFKANNGGYPCGPAVQTCWDFQQLTLPRPLPNPWHYPSEPGLVFSTDAGGQMLLSVAPSPDATEMLSFVRPPGTTAFIDLPEPVNLVRLTTPDTYGTTFYGYDAAGNRWGPFARSSETQNLVEIRGERLTRISMATPLTLAANVSGAIGCAITKPNRLVFVEFGDGVNPNGKISAVDLETATYSVLGTGYTGPEDIVVAFDGVTAYVTERVGNLLRVNLGASTVNRADAVVVSSGMTAPQQLALDEVSNQAYVVEYAASGRLLRIDLGNGAQTSLFSGLNNAVGLLIPPGSTPAIAYVSEQGTGSVSMINFGDGSRRVLVNGLQAPFFLRWNTYRPVRAPEIPASVTMLVTERDPANRVLLLDLEQSPVGVSTMADGLPLRPSSVIPFLNQGFIVCSDSVVSGYTFVSSISEVCAVKADILVQHNEEELARWSETGAVLAPYTTYRLKVLTRVQAQGEGELSGYTQDTSISEYAYFRTDGPHGLAALSTPANYPSSALPFKSGLDDLARYVSQATATPVAGTPGAYTLGIEFNENYVDLLYTLAHRDLTILLYDNNGPARDSQGRLISLNNQLGQVEQLTLTESDISWLAVLTQNGRMFIDPEVIRRNTKLLSPIESQVLASQTLYEARLVPMLLRETFSSGSFINALGQWQTQGASSAAPWQIGNDAGSTFLSMPTSVTSTLLWKPNQPGDWTDYRLSVYLRAATTSPLGVVFRYANANQYYRFTLEPQSDPTQPPHWRLLKVVGGQATPYDLATGFVFKVNEDYLITIEALGSTVRIYQDRQLLFAVTDPALSSGSIGLYCANNAGARFTDVRVDDFRASAPVAYTFSFTTS